MSEVHGLLLSDMVLAMAENGFGEARICYYQWQRMGLVKHASVLLLMCVCVCVSIYI